MSTKVCTKCKEEKELSEFYKNKDKRTSQCILCIKINNTRYYKNNSDKIKKKSATWRALNPEDDKKGKASYYAANRDKFKVKNAKYYTENKEKADRLSAAYNKQRMKTDSVFKLRCNIRSSIYKAFRKGDFSKSKRTQEILGCSFDEFYVHLEMTCIQNYGISIEELECVDYHVDHIIPIALAATEEDVINFNHFSNLQILTAGDNGEKSVSLTWKCPNYD